MAHENDYGFPAVAEQYRTHHPDDVAGHTQIRRAFDIAVDAHAQQRRATGEPYIIHPVAVALTVAALGMDADTVAAALCHDVVEDTLTTVAELAAALGPDAAAIVDGVTKLNAVSAASKAQTNAASLRKLLLAATADPRVLVVKIADRLHNASTLAPLSEAKRRRVATETLEVYAPLARRLGMNETTAALEDYAFSALDPDLYTEISDRIDAAAPDRQAKLDAIMVAATGTLAAAGLPATVTGRKKHVYSTYRKTVDRKQPLDEISDLLGIRVIVEDVAGCYTALGVLHNTFTPVPGRIRDYVAQPRYGHYQSLHTTINVDGLFTEVQIRTWKMHAAAEQGIAGHWRYKTQTDLTAGTPSDPTTAPHLPWLAGLLHRGAADEASPEEFLASVRTDLGVEEVVVFTPTGRPMALPENATVLDAAYAVHTDIGNRATQARVNGSPAPLGQTLHPGDRFEIVTGDRDVVTSDRRTLVTTGRARHAINAALNTRRRTERQTGADALAAALRRTGVGRGWRTRTDLDRIACTHQLRDAAELLEAIGAGTVDPDVVAGTIRAALTADQALPSPPASARPGALAVPGHDDVVLTRAGCCQTVPGHDALGVTDRDGVVTVHATDCLHLATAATPLLEVTVPTQEPTDHVHLTLRALHRRGLLREVTTVLDTAGADVVTLLARTTSRSASTVRLTVAGHSDTVIDQVLAALAAIDGIYAVRRQE